MAPMANTPTPADASSRPHETLKPSESAWVKCTKQTYALPSAKPRTQSPLRAVGGSAKNSGSIAAIAQMTRSQPSPPKSNPRVPPKSLPLIHGPHAPTTIIDAPISAIPLPRGKTSGLTC